MNDICSFTKRGKTMSETDKDAAVFEFASKGLAVCQPARSASGLMMNQQAFRKELGNSLNSGFSKGQPFPYQINEDEQMIMQMIALRKICWPKP